MGNAFAMVLITGVLIIILGLAVKRPLLYALGASEATFPYAMIISVFICWQCICHDQYGDERVYKLSGICRDRYDDCVIAL